MFKKLTICIVFLCILTVGCTINRIYNAPIDLSFQFPNCENCEECLDELDELNFENMIHYEIKTDLDRSVDTELGVTGGKLF